MAYLRLHSFPLLIVGFRALLSEEEGGAALRDGFGLRERLSAARRGVASHGKYKEDHSLVLARHPLQ